MQELLQIGKGLGPNRQPPGLWTKFSVPTLHLHDEQASLTNHPKTEEVENKTAKLHSEIFRDTKQQVYSIRKSVPCFKWMNIVLAFDRQRGEPVILHPWPFVGPLPADAFPALLPGFSSGQRIERLQHVQQSQQIISVSSPWVHLKLALAHSIALDLPEHLPHLEATLGIPGQWDSEGCTKQGMCWIWMNTMEYAPWDLLALVMHFFLTATLWVPPALVGKEGLHLVNPARPRHSP